jgi:hypothetical protein
MPTEIAFRIWAPLGSPWSRWAKPVLFAQMTPDEVGRGLPGAAAVREGVALAAKGYRPVPLFNSCPGPRAAVDLSSIIRELLDGADALKTLRVPADAPPAFLLDDARMRPGRTPGPGDFDNRWMVSPQDFPSASFLLSRGIGRAIVMCARQGGPEEDLTHVLLRWEQGGIRLLGRVRGEPEKPQPLLLQPPSMFRSMWYRALALVGLRRSSAGGWGGDSVSERVLRLWMIPPRLLLPPLGRLAPLRLAALLPPPLVLELTRDESPKKRARPFPRLARLQAGFPPLRFLLPHDERPVVLDRSRGRHYNPAVNRGRPKVASGSGQSSQGPGGFFQVVQCRHLSLKPTNSAFRSTTPRLRSAAATSP